MNIQEVVKQDKDSLLNIYFTAGYPKIDSMPVLLDALSESGVDMVEIGIPYSDPLSDGPTIQNSNAIALKNGISLELIFDQLRAYPSVIPKIMMGYYNSVLQFGVEKFCQKCAECGISGVILPDLPIDLWLEKYKLIFDQYGLSNIFLISPETPEDRIRYIDDHSSSFIYAVSSSGTTGGEQGIQGSEVYLKRISQLVLKHPVLVGFNISKAKDFEFACKYARGGIIGSAYIKQLTNSHNIVQDTKKFISSIFQHTQA
jgi:tryptophan synthase alpha chain